MRCIFINDATRGGGDCLYMSKSINVLSRDNILFVPTYIMLCEKQTQHTYVL